MRIYKIINLIIIYFSINVITGCSSGLDVTNSMIPTGSQLVEHSKNEFDLPYLKNQDPNETIIKGIDYVDGKCTQFFNNIHELNRKLEVGKNVFSSAGTQTLALMSQASESALSIAKVAAVIEVTRVLLEQKQEHYAFSTHATQLRLLTFSAMKKQKKQIGTLMSQGKVTSNVQAIAAVRIYAQNCTIAKIREHWDNSMALAVKVGVSKKEAGTRLSNIRGVETLVFNENTPPSNILGVDEWGINY